MARSEPERIGEEPRKREIFETDEKRKGAVVVGFVQLDREIFFFGGGGL